MLGWKQGAVVLGTLAALVSTAPAASEAIRSEPPLNNNDWDAPVIVESDIDAPVRSGLLDDDPLGLVPKTPFVQRYSLDTDHWEVWLCGATTRTMPQVLTDLDDAAIGYFGALSGGLYIPTFTAGGSIPGDENCLGKFRDGTYPTVGSPEGILIIDSITGGGYASPGQICTGSATDCPSIPTTFPGNGRYAVVDEDALEDFPNVAVHEIGHTLQWPHSFSGITSWEYDNPIDLMSGNAVNLGTPSYTEPEPYATPSYNRYQSGWVSPSDVVVADGTYQAITLEPFNVSGTQLFAIKTALAGEFYVLGTRTSSAYDPIPLSWQGVEVYFVDYYCSEPAFGGGICPGIYREHHQQPPNQYQLVHVLNPGDSVVIEGITVSVTGATASGYTLTSDPDPDIDTEPTAPGTPTSVSGDGQATLTWTASGDGGSPILKYDLEIEDRDGGGSSVTDVGLTLSEVVTGLSNGGTYRARVRAANLVGTGPWSLWSADFMPGTVPAAPGIPAVNAGDAEVAVTWTEPSDDGGVAITNYRIQVNDRTSATDFFLDTGASLARGITGLTNGNTYRIRVRAENTIGAGAWSGWSSDVTPSTTPTAPQSPTATVTSLTSATAAWAPPTSDGGLDILGYELVLENLATSSSMIHDPGLATSVALIGLSTGDTYRFRVRAENADGWSVWGPWSPDFVPGTAPSAPGVPTATAGNAALSVSWVASSGIGAAVDAYELELRNTATGSTSTEEIGVKLTHLFEGLNNGDGYRVRARARNNSGWGPWSGWSNTVTPLPPPDTFNDDDGSIFEVDIEWLAAAGITRGCNPPINNMFCPDNYVTRGQMAAFLGRALNLADDGGGNGFVDDDGSIFEGDIAKLATAGITRGCNPPINNMFCPDNYVTRGQMAAFLHRALEV